MPSHSTLQARRAVLRGGLGFGVAVAAWPRLAFSETAYPTRPVRVLIGTPAGDSADAVARKLAGRLTTLLGQTFFVENKPGAHGFIVAAAAKNAEHDGSTLLVSTGGQMAINPALYGKKLPFEPLKDFEPIVPMMRADLYLYVDAKLPIHDLKEWTAWVKAHRGTVSYGSGGSGTTQHLTMEMLKKATGLEMTHVPYRGSPMVLQDVIGGQIPFAFDAAASILAQARAGTIRLIAVTGPKRSSFAPEVPTFVERGVPGIDARVWVGLFAPAGTPAAVIQRLNELCNRVYKEPDFIEFLRSIGGEPMSSSAEDFRRFIVADTARWTVVVRDAGVQPPE
jgi:tripartite-type tricarboxylate transporter receptor subunit TctC